MKIGLSYRYHPNTTAVYFERAFGTDHEVHYLGLSTETRSGFAVAHDLFVYDEAQSHKFNLILHIDSDGCNFPRGLESLSCPTASYLIDTHRDFGLRSEYAQFFDYVFVAQRNHVDRLRGLGFEQVYWLPLACDPEIHGARERPKVWDVGFVGQIHSPHRARRLALLAERYKVNDYQRRYPKEEIAEVYSKSKIVFNTSIEGDLNMRVFEAMASGAMLITDRIGNGQEDLFKPGVHLVEYGSDEELLEAVDYYLHHDDEREEIARAGRDLVLSEHTYYHRCQQILNTIFTEDTPQLFARARGWSRAELLKGYTDIYYRKHAIEPLLDLIGESRTQRSGYFRVLWKTIVAFTKRLYLGIR